MSERDVAILTKRAHTLKVEMRHELALPKGKRNEQLIRANQARINTINGWLHGSKSKDHVDRKVTTKEEFRDLYKKEFGIEEPDSIIRIENISQLNKVWPAIVGKNVQVEAPPEVKAEIKKRVQKIARKKRIDGFR